MIVNTLKETLNVVRQVNRNNLPITFNHNNLRVEILQSKHKVKKDRVVMHFYSRDTDKIFTSIAVNLKTEMHSMYGINWEKRCELIGKRGNINEDDLFFFLEEIMLMVI